MGEKYIALLLFERKVGGRGVGFTEEIHILSAENQSQAEALAQARGREQEVGYSNQDGDRVEYPLLRVVQVQPFLFSDEAGALLTRSFDDLNAYREVATLRGPLESDLLDPADLPALTQALQGLFDPPFRAEVLADGVGFSWVGRPFGSLGCLGMRSGSVAWSALSAAHDAVLEGMGEAGLYPGPLADAEGYARPIPEGWLLQLFRASGSDHLSGPLRGTEIGRAVWRVGKH